MACMEHQCRNCGNNWFSNASHAACAKCRSTNVAHYWDEAPDAWEDEDPDDDETDIFGDN